jgi:hypothetical protein
VRESRKILERGKFFFVPFVAFCSNSFRVLQKQTKETKLKGTILVSHEMQRPNFVCGFEAERRVELGLTTVNHSLSGASLSVMLCNISSTS